MKCRGKLPNRGGGSRPAAGNQDGHKSINNKEYSAMNTDRIPGHLSEISRMEHRSHQKATEPPIRIPIRRQILSKWLNMCQRMCRFAGEPFNHRIYNLLIKNNMRQNTRTPERPGHFALVNLIKARILHAAESRQNPNPAALPGNRQKSLPCRSYWNSTPRW